MPVTADRSSASRSSQCSRGYLSLRIVGVLWQRTRRRIARGTVGALRDYLRSWRTNRPHHITQGLHIISAGVWLGVDVLVAVLVLAGRFGSSLEVRGVAYQALATFVVWPMLVSGLVCLLTGLVLGLVTKWGLLRYWWVLLKLVLNVV